MYASQYINVCWVLLNVWTSVRSGASSDVSEEPINQIHCVKVFEIECLHICVSKGDCGLSGVFCRLPE